MKKLNFMFDAQKMSKEQMRNVTGGTGGGGGRCACAGIECETLGTGNGDVSFFAFVSDFDCMGANIFCWDAGYEGAKSCSCQDDQC